MTERDSGGGSVPLPSELAELLAARDEAEAARAWDRFLRLSREAPRETG